MDGQAERRQDMLALQLRMNALEIDMKANTALTQTTSEKVDKIEKNTQGLMDIFTGAKTVINTAVGTGTVLRWIAGVSGSIGVILVIITAIINWKTPWP